MEDQPAYGALYQEVPGFQEKVRLQLPALHLLMQLGWSYLTPEEVDRLRGGRLEGAILEPVLAAHIRKQCRFTFMGATHPFTENAIQSAVQALKGVRAAHTTRRNERAYELLCTGTSVPQTIEGDSKSFTIEYIDWKTPANNAFHCTAEFKVERLGFRKYFTADIVLFVNGIPLAVIGCKCSAGTRKRQKTIDRVIDRLGECQAKEGIPHLFVFSQLLMALAPDQACYGTTGTPHQYWAVWKETGLEGALGRTMASPVDDAAMARLLSGPFAPVRGAYQSLVAVGREISDQDRTVYALCRPERLLELVYKFILFDAGAKKIARCQQYFTVRKVLHRVLDAGEGQPRPGGVVWHTQGSGKFLTMVMLAKSLALHPAILKPMIILVTDRTDPDDRIRGTFRACGLVPEKATTGKRLVELLGDRRARVVTTPTHKFAVIANRDLKLVDRDTFFLVDEGYYRRYGEQRDCMHTGLKGACFIAFAGTPLTKDTKNSLYARYGGPFRPAYTIGRAVADKSVVPLLYEARYVPRTLDPSALDDWFKMLTLGFTDQGKADLKRKFSSARRLNKVWRKVLLIAWDVSLHYAATCQQTGLKGQLVAPDKQTALRFKFFMDQFGLVASEVLISSPSSREGEDRRKGPTSEEEKFWRAMMDRFGSEKNYNKQLTNAFNHSENPEIIIVVEKLLSGFGAPCNSVLYLARRLKNHTLLQAIGRINRLHPGKEHGLILDYSGVIRDPDQAGDFFGQFAEFDPTDLEALVTDVRERTDRLPHLHADVWKLFDAVKGDGEPDAFETHLRDDALRSNFYERFNLFAHTLALALSSTRFLMDTPEKTIRRYRTDLRFFQNLRAAAGQRYQEIAADSAIGPGIRKLIETSVGTGDGQQLWEPINLLDTGQLVRLLADESKSTGAKADMIAAAARHVIEREMANDPDYYRKYSKRLQGVIQAWHDGRSGAQETLERVREIAVKIATHTDDDIPRELAGRRMASRYYGCVRESTPSYGSVDPQPAARIAMRIAERLTRHKIRDWRTNPDAINRMRSEIDDILFEVAEERGIPISLEEQDAIIDRCIEAAIADED